MVRPVLAVWIVLLVINGDRHLVQMPLGRALEIRQDNRVLPGQCVLLQQFQTWPALDRLRRQNEHHSDLFVVPLEGQCPSGKQKGHYIASQRLLQKLHPNSRLPKKKRQGKQLSQLDREIHQSLERTRGICERIVGRLKVFKILAERYRNCRKRFRLRFNLNAGLYNYELGLSKSSWLLQELY